MMSAKDCLVLASFATRNGRIVLALNLCSGHAFDTLEFRALKTQKDLYPDLGKYQVSHKDTLIKNAVIPSCETIFHRYVVFPLTSAVLSRCSQSGQSKTWQKLRGPY